MKKSQVNTEKAKVTFKDTKNGEDRVSGLIGRSLELLWEVQKTRGWGDSEYVFPSPRNPDITYDMRKPFKQALESAGVKDFHWPDLRHCVTSFLVEKRVPEVTIMGIQGWKERNMIDLYNHNSNAVVEGQKVTWITSHLPTETRKASWSYCVIEDP